MKALTFIQKSLVLTCVSLVGLAGCEKKTQESKRVSADELNETVPKYNVKDSPTTPSSQVTVQLSDAPYADESKSLETYRAAGVPAIDKPWGSDEYKAAFDAIFKLGKKWEALPRFKSAKSGALFERIVSLDNMNSVATESTPLDQRKTQVQLLMANSTQLLQYYIVRPGLYNRELVECEAFILKLVLLKIQIMDKYVSGLDSKSAEYSKQIEEKKLMHEGVHDVVISALNPLEDWRNTSTSSRLRVCEILAEYLPDLLVQGTPETQEYATNRISGILKHEAEPRIKAAISKLQDKVDRLPKRKATSQPTTRMNFN